MLRRFVLFKIIKLTHVSMYSTAASATAYALLAPPASTSASTTTTTSASASASAPGPATSTTPGGRGQRGSGSGSGSGSPTSPSTSTSIAERRRSYFGFGSVRERLGLARPIALGMPAFPRANLGVSAVLPGSTRSPTQGQTPISPNRHQLRIHRRRWPRPVPPGWSLSSTRLCKRCQTPSAGRSCVIRMGR
jgi:hypothetical protein